MRVYTCVYGGFDSIHPLPPGIEGTCFTDAPRGPIGGWTFVHDPGSRPSRRRSSRYYKIMSHLAFPGEDTLYIDGHIQLVGLPPAAELGCFLHRWIPTSREEVDECLKRGRFVPGDLELARAQVARYAAEGFPDDGGHTENGFIVRGSTPRVQAFNELWLSEYASGCSRDQVCADYARWKTGIPLTVLPGTVARSAYAVKRGHG